MSFVLYTLLMWYTAVPHPTLKVHACPEILPTPRAAVLCGRHSAGGCGLSLWLIPCKENVEIDAPPMDDISAAPTANVVCPQSGRARCV